MNLRSEIEVVFEGRAFARPLFYAYPGGLRFALSEDFLSIKQFLVALQKARSICDDIFTSEGSLVVCLQLREEKSRFAHRKHLSELSEADITIPSERFIWRSRVPTEEQHEEGEDEWLLYVAFAAPLSLLPNLLWCSMAVDCGSIRPRTSCDIYLFNLEQRLMVWPYDDRGMDVVGPNHVRLSELFQKHRVHLNEYDLPAMLGTFDTLTLSSSGLPSAAAELKR